MRKTTIAMTLMTVFSALISTTVCASDGIQFVSTGIFNKDIDRQFIGGISVSEVGAPEKCIGYVEALAVPNLALAKQTDENFDRIAKELDSLKTQQAQSAGPVRVTSVDNNMSVTTSDNSGESSNHEISLKVNPDLSLNSVTLGNAQTNHQQGFFIGGEDANAPATSYLTKDGLKVGKITADAKTGKVSGIAAAELSANSSQAVNGSQLYATNQMIEQNALGLRNMQHQINEVDKNVHKSGANSAALAALHPQDYDENHPFSAAAGVGHYHGESAVAVGMYMRPYENVTFGLGASMTGSDDAMVNLGVSYRFGGAKSVASLSQSDIKQKVVALSTQNDALRAQLECANERSDRSAERVAKLSKELEALKVQMKAIEAMLAKKN